GGDLFDAIAEASKYNECDASGMIYNLASALSYLHSINICHRDIKPENLLVCEHNDGTKSLKLGDFGLAVEIKPGEQLHTVCGTPTYVAPEILAETGYSLKVDVWAGGVIAYILLCGYPPFVSQTNNQDELFDHILRGKFEFSSPFWDEISDSAKELIMNMLEVDPEKRYSAIEVVEHPWVAGDIVPFNDEHISVSNALYSPQFDRKSADTRTEEVKIPLSENIIFKGYANENNQINNGYDCCLPFKLMPQAFEEDLEF
ncbi:serine/threonine-protein kinase DCLK1-like protein, partial [Dinothrombium tinctorium]